MITPSTARREPRMVHVFTGEPLEYFGAFNTLDIALGFFDDLQHRADAGVDFPPGVLPNGWIRLTDENMTEVLRVREGHRWRGPTGADQEHVPAYAALDRRKEPELRARQKESARFAAETLVLFEAARERARQMW